MNCNMEVASRSLTEDQLNNFIWTKIISMKPDGGEDPFYVLDLGLAQSLMELWNTELPNIKPFYAVKCNPEPAFLSALAMPGAGFDCASRSEIELVLGLGVTADRILFANTCKPTAHIKYAASVGVDLATFDSLYEVEKIKRWHPHCAVVLRILASDATCARIPMATKFGALQEEVIPLLEAARSACLPVVGVSFHVGSAVTKPEVYRTAIASAKLVVDKALQLGMPRLQILDIGGGFVADDTSFHDAASEVKEALHSYFRNEPGLKMISEPGRFFAAKSFILVANITGKRVRGNLREYWINDGIYGSMTILHQEPTHLMKPFACQSNPVNPTCYGEVTHASTVYGPTCDPRDTILTEYQLPELEVSDWLMFMNMGAYKASAGSNFNGFNTSAICTYAVGEQSLNKGLAYTEPNVLHD